jgi:hypothetical protein
MAAFPTRSIPAHAPCCCLIARAAWRQLEMTVQIVTKLNRGALIHGRAAYLVPCLGRIEIDRQASGVQFLY